MHIIIIYNDYGDGIGGMYVVLPIDLSMVDIMKS